MMAMSLRCRNRVACNEHIETVLATLLESWLFDVPDAFDGKSLDIDAGTVRSRLDDVLRDEDVRQYIL